LGEATLTAVVPSHADLPMVGIYSAYDGRRLVAAIELVAPGNKDRPEATTAFVKKVLILLHDGVHVLVVGVIGIPRHPVRADILQRLGQASQTTASDQLWLASCCSLPARAPRSQLKVREWAQAVAVGERLPSLPLILRTDQLWVMVEFEATYAETLAAGRYEPV
jgi:hypothetical protein